MGRISVFTQFVSSFRPKMYIALPMTLSLCMQMGVMQQRRILLIFLDCGLRVSELCNLALTEVDFSNYSMNVTGKGS